MVGYGGSSAGSYLATLHPPSPPTVHQLSRLTLQELTQVRSTQQSVYPLIGLLTWVKNAANVYASIYISTTLGLLYIEDRYVTQYSEKATSIRLIGKWRGDRRPFRMCDCNTYAVTYSQWRNDRWEHLRHQPLSRRKRSNTDVIKANMCIAISLERKSKFMYSYIL